MTQNLFSINRTLAFAAILSFVTPLFAIRDQRDSAKLSDEQKAIHILNRLGFGARPGDVARVRAMGISKYIEQQLNPDAIDDSVVKSKTANLDVFSMTTSEIFTKYPNPGALLRALDGNGMQRGVNTANNAEPTADERRQRQQKLRDYYRKYDLKPAAQIQPQIISNRFLHAVYSERQLQEVMVDFWQNHFNVFSGKGAVRWYIPSYERDVLRKHALGNFRDLVVATAQHPAMLFYLDNYESVAPSSQQRQQNNGGMLQQAIRNGTLTRVQRERIKSRQGITDEQLNDRIKRAQGNQNRTRQTRGLNENYARELMELHTMGVDSGYTQNDIVEVARAFTGWTIADPRGYRKAAAAEILGTEQNRLDRLQRAAGVSDDVKSGEFYFNEGWHDKNLKVVLGDKVNEGGIKDGLKVIDILVKQPATAKFIARKLAVKFVSDSPSEQLVDRLANTFAKSNGDIKTTLRSLFNDKEFFAAANYRSKIKTPFELAASAVRTIGAETMPSASFMALLNKLGEVPYGYQAPTGYPDSAEDWVNTGALLERLNFSIALASNRIPGTRVSLSKFEAANRNLILEKTIAAVLNDDVSVATKNTLAKQVEKPLPQVSAPIETVDDVETDMMETNGAQRRVRNARRAQLLDPSGNPEVIKVVSLVLGTPEFQRQ